VAATLSVVLVDMPQVVLVEHNPTAFPVYEGNQFSADTLSFFYLLVTLYRR
jgi:hypothetical protein